MEKLQKVVPTPELLSEMEELEILGGEVGNGNFNLSHCTVNNYTGNCVAGCACSKPDN